MLSELKKRGYALFLVSRTAPSRIELIRSFGLESFFDEICISDSKNARDFLRLAENGGVSKQNTYVIGDRVRGEIKIGNVLGLVTVWIRKGKFSDEVPKDNTEQPTHTVQNLDDIGALL